VLRFFSFFPSVIDQDESTYLEVARMLLSGKLLYVDMVDIKPPGIFLILAFFQAVFGYSIFVLRLLTALWIAVTAFMLYITAKMLVRDAKSAFASGIIYIFMISTWSFFGISLTPEIFFNLFTIVALVLLLKNQSTLNFIIAGLVAGLGFLIKYFVLFDFAAFMLFLVIIGYRSEKGLNFKRVIISNFLAGIGFIIPFAVVNLFYYLNGHFDDFYNIVYLAPARYPSAFDAWKMLKFILEFHLLFLPVFFMFYYVLSGRKQSMPAIQQAKLLAVTWAAFALVAVLIAGKTFGHYTIQLMLPVSLLAGLFFHSERTHPSYINRIISPKTGGIIFAILIITITFLKNEYYTRKDIPREIAAYLKPRLNEADVIYAGNYHHILYYLLKKDSPTKYIHRTLLFKDTHIRALNINTDEEFRKIMAARPVYIITMKDFPAGMMKDFIMTNYTLEKEFEGEIKLFRRTAE
jgi:4-amino-4-deoxy-L-arabinose transferase-like glycosyltransferase